MGQEEAAGPVLSIIILNHNGFSRNRNTLLSCIRSALSVALPSEVIFVDNGSTDGSLQAVKQMFSDKMRYVALGSNMGYSGGMNAGFMRVSPGSKYVLFTNNDVVFPPEAVHGLVRLLEQDPSVAVASCNIVKYYNKPGHVRGGSFLDLLLVHHFPRGKTQPYPVTMVENFYVVRKKFFEAVGGFDTEFFFGFDESMLCLKAWFTGNRVVCDPRFLVRHAHWPPRKSFSRYKTTRNKYILMVELYDGRFLLSWLPYKIVADVFYSIASPVWRERRAIKSVVTGILDLLLNFRQYYSKRLRYKRLKVISQKELVEQGVFVGRSPSQFAQA